MRAIAFRMDTASGTPSIRSVSRIDVWADPIFGAASSQPLSAHYDPRQQSSRPFAGSRLERALHAPCSPDVLVAATSATIRMVPEELRRDVPWIVALRALTRLSPLVPNWLLSLEESHADTSETGVLLLTRVLLLLLEKASPLELVWLSREEGTDPHKPSNGGVSHGV